MDLATFHKFSDLVYEKSGISLHEGKVALVNARVGKRMRTLGIPSYEDYFERVMEDRTGDEVVQLLDVISTNVTSFFREGDHFDFIAQKVRQWQSAGQKRFRFWCAACSTGEEPYSLAMTVLETLGDLQADVRILATDISTRVLDECAAGRYTAERIEPVPPAYRQRHFSVERRKGRLVYAVRPELAAHVVFRRLNLASMPFPMKGPLDMVLLRNVMIYFSRDMNRRLLEEIHRLVKPGGYLITGHAESLTGMISPFKFVRPSIYMKQ